MTKHPRISRRLPPAIAAQVEALIIGYGIRFGEDTVADCCALFLDAVVPAEAGSTIKVHRFRPARAMELARGCITEAATNGGNLATTAAGALFVLARRGEGQ